MTTDMYRMIETKRMIKQLKEELDIIDERIEREESYLADSNRRAYREMKLEKIRVMRFRRKELLHEINNLRKTLPFGDIEQDSEPYTSIQDYCNEMFDINRVIEFIKGCIPVQNDKRVRIKVALPTGDKTRLKAYRRFNKEEEAYSWCNSHSATKIYG